MVKVTDPIAEAWRLAWTAPDRRANYEWAAAEVDLQGDYAKTGKFSIGDSTYLIFGFRCLDNDVVRMLNVLKSPRTGGSLLADVWFQHVFKNRPGPFLATHQTDDDAERHYLTKTKKTFEATSANAELFATLQRKRDLLLFAHMTAIFQGANMSSLQGKPAKYEWNDEVWLWKPGMLSQAFSRTDDFKRTCKILNISQGANMKSEWELVYNAGKRHNYAVRCTACGKLQAYEFFATMVDTAGNEILDERGKPVRAGVVWDLTARTKDGRWNISRAAETTRWKCRHCGHEHKDEYRSYELLATSGDVICLDPDRPDIDMSYRWNAMVGGDWWRLTKKFLQACEVRDFAGATTPLEDFYKKELAMFWDPSMQIQKVELNTIADLRMEPAMAANYTPCKLEWETNRFITADYQAGTGNDTRHLLVVVRAWSDEVRNRSRLLWWGRVNTFAQLYQLQLAMKVDPACVAVDGGFEMMEVAAQCAKYGWTMLLGDDPDYFLHHRKKGPSVRRPFSPLFKTDPLKGKSGQGTSYCWTMYWSNPAIKNLLWNLRHGLSRHTWEIPGDVPVEFIDGIDSEQKKWIYKKGSAVPVPVWVKVKPYNHPWDGECMQTVLSVAAGCLTFDVEENQVPNSAAGDKPKDEAPKAPHHAPDQLELIST